jgi:hypothetical protein
MLVEKDLKEEKCEECDIVSWNSKEITFELHHVDGDIDNDKVFI